jgi:nucleoside-diphosphate-sugar epimerase
VRALARSAAAAEAVQRAGAEPVLGELTDRPLLAEALRGCTAVVHAAASTALWDLTDSAYTANVTGTETLLATAREAGVPRFIHISTEAVLLDAGGAALVGVDEQHPYPQRPTGVYPQTKGLAEQRVRAASSPGLTTIVLRPRLVWGPNDTSLLAGVSAAVHAGQWVWIGGGRHLTSTTHIANVAEGVRLALEHGQGGQVYFLSDGAPVEFRSFMTALLATQGVDPGERTLGRAVAWVLAGALEALWRGLRLRGAPPLHQTIVQLLGSEVTVDDGLARRELGYVGRMTRERGLREMVEAGRAAPVATSPLTDSARA